MGKTVSIAITARDNFSTAITTMRNNSQAFTKDVTGLQTKLNALNANKITLKVDVDKAKTALKEAEQQFKKTGDAADQMNLELAHSNYENARRNLSLVSTNARQAEKDILNLTSSMSKADNRAGTMSSVGSNSIMSRLGASGAAAYLGGIAGNAANAFVGSAYGSDAGTYFGSALTGAGMGAAIGTAIAPGIGTAIAPGIGTAIGAVLGGLTGLIDGAIKAFEKDDDAFKEYYKTQYETVTQAQRDALSSGSMIAANREQKMISFSTLLKSPENAKSYLGQMTEFANKTPFEYDTLAKISQTLLAYKYKQNELIPLLTNVGNAGAALSMSGQDMTEVATGLGRMKSSGKTTLEYLNPLLERGIPVWDYLAKASGKTNEEVQEMVSKGLVPGEKAAKAISDYMGFEFAGSMEKQSQTYLGLQSTLQDAQAQLNNSMGEGYNELRKKGMQKQIDFLGGQSGAAMQDAYNKIGQFRASLENKKEQLQRDALGSVMSGTLADSYASSEQKVKLESLMQQYQEEKRKFNDSANLGDTSAADKAGAEMGRILAEAQAIAQNDYNASSGAQLELDTQKKLANDLKNNAELNSLYWDAGYEKGKWFSEGLASAHRENTPPALAPPPADYSSTVQPPYQIYKVSGRAYGLSYVPYDNFPAMLHEGERVLTASEARGYGGGVVVQVSGNSFTVREEADIDKVAQALADKLARAQQLAE